MPTSCRLPTFMPAAEGPVNAIRVTLLAAKAAAKALQTVHLKRVFGLFCRGGGCQPHEPHEPHLWILRQMRPRSPRHARLTTLEVRRVRLVRRGS
jgi:hypothetical protein